MTAQATRLGAAPEWVPETPADLFGLDPADPPRVPMRSRAPVGVTLVMPTCADPTGSRAASMLTALRTVISSAQRSGLPAAVIVAADGLPADDVAAIRSATASLGCACEVTTTGPVPSGTARSPARTRNHALALLASLPARSPLRQRYLLLLDDDSTLPPGGAEALVSVLEAEPTAIAACPAIVPVADLASWRPPPVPRQPAGTRLPGPWRDGHYDLLSVTSHGSLITGRIVGLLARTEPVLSWIAGGGRMFCATTPRASTEDMLALAALAKLGPVLGVRQVQAADQARTTPAATRAQQLRWGYDHAWLVRALASVGLLRHGVHGLVWRRSHGWHEVHVDAGGPDGPGAMGVLVNPAQLGVLAGVLSAVAAEPETAAAVAGRDAGELAAAAFAADTGPALVVRSSGSGAVASPARPARAGARRLGQPARRPGQPARPCRWQRSRQPALGPERAGHPAASALRNPAARRGSRRSHGRNLMGTRRAVLLDVDGVLLDSTAAHQAVWRQWARSRGLDVATVLAACAGRRPQDTVREVAPHLDPEAERQALDTLTRSCQVEVAAISGAASLLCSLPADRWAIVSSGSAWYVREMFGRLRLPLPRIQVYGEDVEQCKPAPDGYLLAARELGVDPSRCLVVEDSPAGVLAGKAARCAVIAVGTDHPISAPRPADVYVRALPAAASLVHEWLRDGWQPAREPGNH